MSHTHKYFSEIHADKNSQFFALPHSTPDNEETAESRRKLAAEPDDYALLMDFAKRLNFQLRYREAIEVYNRALELRPDDCDVRLARAPRYYNTLQFDKAYADYAYCLERSPDNAYALYRLGITAYAMGKNSEAEACFTRCMAHYANEPEMLVASAYWLAMTVARTRSGNAEWRSFDFALDIGHHTGYRDGLAVLCGKSNAGETYSSWLADADTLNASIVLYALVAHYRLNGDSVMENEVFYALMRTDEYWAGFAYIAAWAER
ncbi:MAG: tetratricopeptide repeat protein [Oscillospiraceae bacterium]|jgi:tetratricopeptide (TPR) repeat protein|nr:tetratricopeptide repeat protein [Oscillospiraceae bacterium]